MPKMSQINLKKIENKNTELLEIDGNIFGIEVKIIIVYFDANRDDTGKVRNKKLKKIIEKKIEQNEKEGLIIAGDFNGHIRIIDEREDINGKMITEWVEGYEMILLNLDEKCEGKYTRIRGEQKTTVDYILVNKKIYDSFENMKIDEEKELIENSDHVVMSMKLKVENGNNGFKKTKWKIKEFLSEEEKDIEELAEKI